MTERSHILLNEAGGYAHVAGVSLQAVDGPGGEIDLARLQAKLRNPANIHHPVTCLVCMENTHNACGGTVISMENMAAVRYFTRANNIQAHLDGARIFNAAHVLNVRAADIASFFESVMFCLSKGLSAPIGSMLAGSRSFIAQADRMRKILGGGMRQAGIAAAAGLIALKQMTGRLVEDHETARLIAEGIADCTDISLDMNSVQTNMVRFEIFPGKGSAAALIEALRQEDVLALSQSQQAVRLVTHRHISKQAAREAAARILKAVSAL